MTTPPKELKPLKFIEAHVKPMDSHELARLPLTKMREQIARQEKQELDKGIMSSRANELLSYLRAGGTVHYFKDGRGLNYRRTNGDRVHPDIINQLIPRGFFKSECFK
jgi:hypothetical protein